MAEAARSRSGEHGLSQRSSEVRDSLPDERAAASAVPPMGTRIDPPHPMRTDSAPAATPEPIDDAQLAEPIFVDDESWVFAEWGEAADELERQASQLQRHLAERLKELDRREAVVNARSAELENQARGARLWLREEQATLDEREASVHQRELALVNRLSDIAAAEVYQEHARTGTEERASARDAELAQRERQLEALRERLAQERAALDVAEQRLGELRLETEARQRQAAQEIAQEKANSQEMNRRLLQGVERRRQALERQSGSTAERTDLADAGSTRKELAKRELALAMRERRFMTRARGMRDRMLEKARRWAARLRREEQRIGQERDELLKRRTELEAQRVEVNRRRQELLELRASAEHLLAELSSRQERQALTESLAATRAEIATHYQQSRDDLAEQQRALATLKSEVAARYRQLVHHRDEIINLSRQRRLSAARQQAESSSRRGASER